MVGKNTAVNAKAAVKKTPLKGAQAIRDATSRMQNSLQGAIGQMEWRQEAEATLCLQTGLIASMSKQLDRIEAGMRFDTELRSSVQERLPDADPRMNGASDRMIGRLKSAECSVVSGPIRERSEIDRSVSVLQDAVASVHDVLVILEERLGPVLRECGGTAGGPGSERPVVTCALSDLIVSAAGGVGSFRDRIVNLLDRLTL